MIELAFGESAAGALKLAKSMKRGDRFRGAVAVIGETQEGQEARIPSTWTGVTMEGTSADVAALTFAWDIGDIVQADALAARKAVLDRLFGVYPGVVEEIWWNNLHALDRVKRAASSGEKIRMWVGPHDPAEMCALYWTCAFLRDAPVPLSVVRIPDRLWKDDCIVSYCSMGEVVPEELGALAQLEEPIAKAERCLYSSTWRDLQRENAPLRAVVNGCVMSVPEDFYDFVLRAEIGEGECLIARILGKALTRMPGVGDRWLFLRLQAMMRTGELTLCRPAEDDHPYSGVVRLRAEAGKTMRE